MPSLGTDEPRIWMLELDLFQLQFWCWPILEPNTELQSALSILGFNQQIKNIGEKSRKFKKGHTWISHMLATIYIAFTLY